MGVRPQKHNHSNRIHVLKKHMYGEHAACSQEHPPNTGRYLLRPAVVRGRGKVAGGVGEADAEVPLFAPLRTPTVRDQPVPEMLCFVGRREVRRYTMQWYMVQAHTLCRRCIIHTCLGTGGGLPGGVPSATKQHPSVLPSPWLPHG